MQGNTSLDELMRNGKELVDTEKFTEAYDFYAAAMESQASSASEKALKALAYLEAALCFEALDQVCCSSSFCLISFNAPL